MFSAPWSLCVFGLRRHWTRSSSACPVSSLWNVLRADQIQFPVIEPTCVLQWGLQKHAKQHWHDPERRVVGGYSSDLALSSRPICSPVSASTRDTAVIFFITPQKKLQKAARRSTKLVKLNKQALKRNCIARKQRSRFTKSRYDFETAKVGLRVITITAFGALGPDCSDVMGLWGNNRFLAAACGFLC